MLMSRRENMPAMSLPPLSAFISLPAYTCWATRGACWRWNAAILRDVTRDAALIAAIYAADMTLAARAFPRCYDATSANSCHDA